MLECDKYKRVKADLISLSKRVYITWRRAPNKPNALYRDIYYLARMQLLSFERISCVSTTSKMTSVEYTEYPSSTRVAKSIVRWTGNNVAVFASIEYSNCPTGFDV